MRNIYKHRYEIAAFLLEVVLFTVILYLGIVAPEKEPLRTILYISLIPNAILLFLALREIWRRKLKKKAMSALHRIASKIAKALTAFLEKWNVLRGENKNILTGKTTVFFDLSLHASQNQKRSKPLKWKQLKTDRERLRYLYRRMITNKIKSGVDIKPCDTPLELKELCSSDDFEVKLFETYIDFRYDERKVIPSQTIYSLKDNIADL